MYINCPTNIGIINPTQKSKNDSIKANETKLDIKGIGKDTTVLKKAERHRIPKAWGDEEPPTLFVTNALIKAPETGARMIINVK